MPWVETNFNSDACRKNQELALKKYNILLRKIIDKYIEIYGLKEPIDTKLIFSDDNFKNFRDKLGELRIKLKGSPSFSYDTVSFIEEYERRGGGRERQQIEKAKARLPFLVELIEEYGPNATLFEIVVTIEKNYSPEDLKLAHELIKKNQ